MDFLFRLLCINEVPLNGSNFHGILYIIFDAMLNSFVLKLKVTYVTEFDIYQLMHFSVQ